MDNEMNNIAGPVDTCLLTLQPKHRSTRIWMSGVNSMVRPRRADSVFWDLVSQRRLHRRVCELLHMMGLYGVYQCGRIPLDYHLVTALVERWRPETHTFHFPVGEATLTLQDIAVLWHVPIDGRPVTGRLLERSRQEWLDLCEELLGFKPGVEDIDRTELNAVALGTHIDKVEINDDTLEDEVVQFTRVCALVLISGMMCPSRTGNRLQLRYLPLLRDVHKVGHYSWGSATLAFLYRQLCTATLAKDTCNLGGAVQLLQLWAYSRILTIRPIRGEDRGDFSATPPHKLPPAPYAALWYRHFRYGNTVRNSLLAFRDMFDRMTTKEFEWLPYADTDMSTLPNRCNSKHWRYRVPLINFAIVEWHYPDRVMRQFGMVQGIPPAPADSHERLHDTDVRHHPGGDWGTIHSTYMQLWRDRVQYTATSPLIQEYGSETMPEYGQWYYFITRRLINNPACNHDEGYHGAPTDLLHLAYKVLHNIANMSTDPAAAAQARTLLPSFNRYGIFSLQTPSQDRSLIATSGPELQPSPIQSIGHRPSTRHASYGESSASILATHTHRLGFQGTPIPSDMGLGHEAVPNNDGANDNDDRGNAPIKRAKRRKARCGRGTEEHM